MQGRISSVSVVHRILPDPRGPGIGTAIDKRPVAGPVEVRRLGLVGDTQCDQRYHGGPDQAVYVYADEDAAWWAEQLGREIEPGLFGENLRSSGIDVTGAEIGERWEIGDSDGVLAEVTAPRTPCYKFAAVMREPRWVKRFAQANRQGAYLRVLREGRVAPGDALNVVHRPGHGVRISDVGVDLEPAALTLLDLEADGELALHDALRERLLAARARA